MMMAEFGDQKRRDYHHENFISNREDKCSAKKHKSGGSPKEKKDKVGERVAKLQQLVSPYGKTDTASVLQEATGYINFLHDQLQVLSAPYIERGADRNTMQRMVQFKKSRSMPYAYRIYAENCSNQRS